jgi:predicted transcriptional regulator
MFAQKAGPIEIFRSVGQARKLKRLVLTGQSITVSYMNSILTIRLDEDLQSLLDRACTMAGRTRSDLAREALKRQLAITTFEQLRQQVMPYAEKAGLLTDEDVFQAIS